MSILIEYHGIVAEVCGTDKENAEKADTLGTLKEVLCERHPGLDKYNFTAAVNGVIETDEIQLAEGDRVSLLPPLPGG